MSSSRRPKATEAVPVAKRKVQPEKEELWKEFLGPDAPYYDALDNELKNVHCGLCGNTGVIDTRGKVLTPAGAPCGVRRFCICPNGRALKKSHSGKLIPPEEN
jgi:hypothetical protein